MRIKGQIRVWEVVQRWNKCDGLGNTYRYRKSIKKKRERFCRVGINAAKVRQLIARDRDYDGCNEIY